MLGKAKKTGIAAIFATTVACGVKPASESSQVKVTNGVEINEEDFPATVLISGKLDRGSWICTGTFVNDYQMVSAAHCVEGLDPQNPNLYVVGFRQTAEGPKAFGKAKAKKLVKHRRYKIDGNDGGVNGYDISVINFPRNTSSHWVKIARRSPKIDSRIAIVGYGNNRNYIDRAGNLSGDGSGVKRVGVNTVGGLYDGLILFAGLPQADGQTPTGYKVSSGSGDSGGPMYQNGKLVGITSGGGLGAHPDRPEVPVAISKYVDINSPSSRLFLRRHLNL